MADPFHDNDDDIATLADLTGLSTQRARRLLDLHGGSIESAAVAYVEESGAETAAQVISKSEDEAQPLKAATAEPLVDAAAYRLATTGETFRRRILAGVAAEEQLIVDEHRPHHMVDWKSRAGAGEWPITLEIHNRSVTLCEVCWIDWQAVPQRFGALPPGGTFRQKTHAEHAWLVRSVGLASGGSGSETRPLFVFMAKRTDQLEHGLTIAAVWPELSVLERVAAGDGADGKRAGAGGVLRFLRLLVSLEGSILLGLVAALLWFKKTA